MSEITIARMKGDIEAVRVAELYANHPLLKNMPVPHFRLPNIEIEVPVVIQHMEEESSEEAPRGTPSIREMAGAFDKVVKRVASEEGIKLTAADTRRMRSAMTRKAATLSTPRDVSVDVNRIASELSRESAKLLTIEGPADREVQPVLEAKLRDVARVEFDKLRKPPARLKVLVNTSAVKEAGPRDVVTNIHLKISEEAFEWTVLDMDGEQVDRLVIE